MKQFIPCRAITTCTCKCITNACTFNVKRDQNVFHCIETGSPMPVAWLVEKK